jgi:hypothetical protein
LLIAGQDLVDFIEVDLGEEAELAEVHAQGGDLLVGHLPGGAEDGAVAAQDQGQFGRMPAQVGFLEEINDDNFAAPFQEREEFVGSLDDAGPAAITEQEDTHGEIVRVGLLC